MDDYDPDLLDDEPEPDPDLESGDWWDHPSLTADDRNSSLLA